MAVFVISACDDSLGIEDNVSKKMLAGDTTIIDSSKRDTVLIRDTTRLHDTTRVSDTTWVVDTTKIHDTTYIPIEKSTIVKMTNLNFSMFEFYYYKNSWNPIAQFQWPYQTYSIKGTVDTSQYYPTPYIYADLKALNENFNENGLNKDYVVKHIIINLTKKIPLSPTYYIDASVDNGNWCTIEIKDRNGAIKTYNAKSANAILQFMEWKTTFSGRIKGARLYFYSQFSGIYNDMAFQGTIDFEF